MFILESGGDARTRDECQARGAGRAGPACPPSVRPSVRAYVTRQKGPKRTSNSLKFHWVFTKSEKVKILLNLHISALAKCPRNHWFAQGFGVEEAEKPFSSRARKFGVRWSKKVSFFTFCGCLSRNASIFAFKSSMTLKYVPDFEK